jgi:hypothetical protein
MRPTYEAGAGHWSMGEIAKANEALGHDKHYVRGNSQ